MEKKFEVRCNMCGWKGKEDDLELIDEGYCEDIREHTFFNGCPNCKTDSYLMDI